MSVERGGLAQSVQVRLARYAKEIGVDPNLVLTRYGVERFLYRLSRSPHAEKFVLKGALLLLVWLGETLRPTRDADLLGFRAYPRETVAAEKLHAMVLLGMRNSRMKDYFDVHALLREGELGASRLARAIASTFERRRTEVPEGLPAGLSDAFSDDAGHQAQWRAFLDKNRLQGPSLPDLVRGIREGLSQALEEARRKVKA